MKLSGHACQVKNKLELTASLTYHSETGAHIVFKVEVLAHHTRKGQQKNQEYLLYQWTTWEWLTKNLTWMRIRQLC